MSRHLPDVQAFVLDPLATVTVGVLESEVVVWAELLRKDVVCEEFCQFMRLVRLTITIQAYRPQPKPVGCSSGRP
jgi:nucleoside permease NupC